MTAVEEARARVAAFVQARTHAPGLDPDDVIGYDGTMLRLSDLRLLAAAPADTLLIVDAYDLDLEVRCEEDASSATASGQLLVRVWPDGTGEVAWRPYEGASWGPPAPGKPAA